MGCLKNIQVYFHKRFLRQKLAAMRPFARKRLNLDSAQSVGLLFDASSLERQQVALDYAGKLRQAGKRVTMLGFFDQFQEEASFSFGFFTRKQIDWALRPTGKAVEDFLHQTFDMLIHLSTGPEPHFEYISALTPAHLKVGPPTEHTYAYDVMIDVRNKQSVPDFIREMEKLLKKTNTPEHALA